MFASEKIMSLQGILSLTTIIKKQSLSVFFSFIKQFVAFELRGLVSI